MAQVRRLSWSADSRRLASASWDQTVRLWDLASAQGIATFRCQGKAQAVEWSPDGREIAAGSDPGGIVLFDASATKRALHLRHAGQARQILPMDTGEVFGVFGLMGAGRTELLESIYGLRPRHTSGGVFVDSKECALRPASGRSRASWAWS